MKEQACLLGKTRSLVGIVTEPKAGHRPDGRPAVLLLNAGLVHRVGPNRIYVKIARRLAANGFLVLRFDLSGIGDSRGRSDGLPLQEAVISDAKEAMDFLAAQRGADRFILMGICSGANNSLRVAQNDARIVGAALIEPYYFGSFRYYLYVYGKRLFKPRSWLRLLTMKSDFWTNLKKKKAGRAAATDRSRQGQTVLHRHRPLKNHITDEIRSLVTRGVHVSLVYCLDSPSYYNHYLQIRPELDSLKQSGRLEAKVFSESDHTFTLLSNQESLAEAIQSWAMGAVPALSSPSLKKEVVG